MSSTEPDAPSGSTGTDTGTDTAISTKRSILASSAVMAAGTMFSRLSGLIRAVLLAAALGSVGVAADAFQVANTIPTMLYILLAGGAINAVLVPQLVRALKNDADRGEAYTHRVMTLGVLFLGAVTVLLVIGAPLLLRIFLAERWYEPEMAVALDSATTLARWCLPQVFFYGMFTLVGQVLNARGSFGPMMWAPIANNVIAVATLVTFLVVYGPVEGLAAQGHLSNGQMALLGFGSTLGIVTQLLVLVPFMKRAGYVFRPRFDFRGTGLTHTARLAIWTVLFVVVNQVAYSLVVRLLSEGTAAGEAGQTVYANSFLITMLPHGVVTVSLVTALLPRLSQFAADGERHDLARTLTGTLRTALLITLPFSVVLVVLGSDVANVLYGHGASAGTAGSYGPTLAAFALALVFFTVHYFMLRGFYALERTRTVFLIQLVVASVNIAAAVVVATTLPLEHRAAGMAASYALAYGTGALVSWLALRATLGGLDGRRMLRFAVRLTVASVLSGAIAFVVWLVLGGWNHDSAPALSFVRGVVVGPVLLVVYLVLARAFRITELAELLAPLSASVRRRLRRS